MIAHFYFLINIKPRMFCECFISWKLQKCFDKIRKLFWKKKTFIHLFQWICVSYLRFFRKLIPFRSDYEPPPMRTLVKATTKKKIKNVKKQLKTKKRLFKMFQKNKNPKAFQMKHRKRHELSSKKMICITRIFEKKVASATSWQFTCKSFWPNQNFNSFEKTIFVVRNLSKN